MVKTTYEFLLFVSHWHPLFGKLTAVDLPDYCLSCIYIIIIMPLYLSHTFPRFIPYRAYLELSQFFGVTNAMDTYRGRVKKD